VPRKPRRQQAGEVGDLEYRSLKIEKYLGPGRRGFRHQTLERLERVYSVLADTQELLRARRKVIAKSWDELDAGRPALLDKAGRHGRSGLCLVVPQACDR
jgi:hypothetical protein